MVNSNKDTENNKVYRLIDNLTKSEKRYIKVYMSSKKGAASNLSLKLFDAISKLKSIPISDFEKKLDWAKSLPKLKHDLSNIILKQLEHYHSASSNTIKLRRFLIQIEILYKKKLFQDCNKIILKALKLAREIEAYAIATELNMWRIKIYGSQIKTSNGLQSKNIEGFNLVLDSNDSDIEKLTHIYQFQKASNQILCLSLQGKTTAIRKQIQNILDNSFFTKKNSLKTLHSRYHYNSLWITYFFFDRSVSNVYSNAHDNLQLFLENKQFKEADIEKYIAVVYNYINVSIETIRERETKRGLALLLEIPVENKSQSINIYRLYAQSMLIYIFLFGKTNKIQFLEKYVRLNLLNYGKRNKDMVFKIIITNLSIILFLSESYRKALFYSNLVMQYDTINISKYDPYPLDILIHYELGNMAMTESLFLSYKRKIKKIKNTLLQKWFINFYTGLEKNKQNASFFKEQERNLLKLFPSKSTSVKRDYLEFFIWIRLKHDKTTLSNALLECSRLEYKEYKEKRLLELG